MSKLYVMCGLPFSGKTTLARKIADHIKCEFIGFDSIWKELELKIDPKMDKTEEWKFIIKKAHEKIKTLLKNNVSVVYDDINARYEHREALRRIAKACNATTKVIFVDTPITIIKEREKINKLTKKRHAVATENFEKALFQFQKPTYKENVIRFTPSDNIEKWLNQLADKKTVSLSLLSKNAVSFGKKDLARNFNKYFEASLK